MKNILSKIRVDNWTYILLFFAFLAGYIKVMVIIIMIVIIHEMGHVFFLKLFKINIEVIKIYPFGGLTIINERLHERIYKNIIISLGGIIFQLLLVLFVMMSRSRMLDSTYNLFIKYNQILILFNLLPIIPLDGSKLLNSFFNMFFSFNMCYWITVVISIISLILFIIYNLIFSINDFIIYIFFILHILKAFKEYKYVLNRFYLERVMYDHYYNKIINISRYFFGFRINKYYYFYDGKKYINERNYIRKRFF